MQVYQEDAPPRDACHLFKHGYDPVVFQMMCKERAHGVIKLAVRERKPERITTHRRDGGKHMRLFQNRTRRARVQFKPHEASTSFRLNSPACRNSEQLA